VALDKMPAAITITVFASARRKLLVLNEIAPLLSFASALELVTKSRPAFVIPLVELDVLVIDGCSRAD
jgi:hypothetical protein